MNASRFAIGLVGVALAGLWYFAGGAEPLPASSAAEPVPRVAAPVGHENLSVYFVYGPDTMPDVKVLSLGEALERDLAVVHETSSVNVLAVENKSPDHELFIQSGDIVKGGKQDRMAQTDMLLPPMSGVVSMPAHCVEQGRWTGRGSEDTARFKSSGKCAVGNELKIANYNGQQSAVWQRVSENQGKIRENVDAAATANASPTSFQLTLEAPAVQAKVAEYEAALKDAAGRDGVVGVVFVVNGKVTGAEVYGSRVLFQKAWPKLLNAAAVEAVAERTGSGATVPTAREVERFLAYGAADEPAGDAAKPADGSFTGRSGATRSALVSSHGGNEDNVTSLRGRAPNRAGQFAMGGSVNSNVGLNDPEQTSGGAQPQPLPSPQPVAANPDGRVILHTDSVTRGGSGRAPGRPQPAPADGNRLNSNRTENDSALMVESRDPARQNAVIHRSYIKK